MRTPATLLTLTAALTLAPLGAAATEMSSSRLVFDKSVKMKKLDATVYLAYSAAPDSLLCGVVARGKGGPMAASGSFRLRLVGERSAGTATWESGALSAEVDEIGDAAFGREEIAELVTEAAGADAEIGLYRIDFRGGRGGRVAELALDCRRQGSGS